MCYDGRHRRAHRKRPVAVHWFGTLAALVLLLMACAPQGAAPEKALDSRRSPYDAITLPPGGWHRLAPVQVATGSELFAVINGGAAMYLNAGFRSAAFAVYEHPGGTTVHLEIYHMTTTAAAETVQARKVGPDGVTADIGGDAVFEDRYLNFVKGPYQVTVYGYDSGQQTVQGIMAIARVIAQRLPAR